MATPTPLKVEVSREWCEHAALDEKAAGDPDCTTGQPAAPPPDARLVALVRRMLDAYARELTTRSRWAADPEPWSPESRQMFEAVLAREAETRDAALAVHAALPASRPCGAGTSRLRLPE